MNIGEYSPRQSRGEYSPMLTGPEANNFCSMIFRGEYQGAQNNGLNHKNTDAMHGSFAHKYTVVVLISLH